MANLLSLAGPDSKYKVLGAAPAGFWAGLWHGIIAPFTFFISLLNPNVSMFETNNNGNVL